LCLRSKVLDAELILAAAAAAANEVLPPVKEEELYSTTLVKYSQNIDPDWKTMPVAFCDVRTNTYIDCNLVFYVKVPPSLSMGEDGVEYALGVPCEIPIVVTLELEDDASADNADDKGVANLYKVGPINPDDYDFWEGSEAMMHDEEKEEVFQLATRALIDEYGPVIRLKKTTRVLTIEGDMDCVVGNWREALLGGGSKRDTMVELSIDDALNVYDDEDDVIWRCYT
jgi:hypothetical protein